MNETEPRPVTYARGRPPPVPPSTGESLVWSVVCAGLFLYVGFAMGLAGISGNPVYDGSVTAFVWAARVVGIGILVVAGLSLAHVPGAMLLDLLVSALAAAMCLIVGLIWIAFGDMEGILALLFGLVNSSAARSAWQRWRWSAAVARPTAPPDEQG